MSEAQDGWTPWSGATADFAPSGLGSLELASGSVGEADVCAAGWRVVSRGAPSGRTYKEYLAPDGRRIRSLVGARHVIQQDRAVEAAAPLVQGGGEQR